MCVQEQGWGFIHFWLREAQQNREHDCGRREGWRAGRDNSFWTLSPGGGDKTRTVARGVDKFTRCFCGCPFLVCGLTGIIEQLEKLMMLERGRLGTSILEEARGNVTWCQVSTPLWSTFFSFSPPGRALSPAGGVLTETFPLCPGSSAYRPTVLTGGIFLLARI